MSWPKNAKRLVNRLAVSEGPDARSRGPPPLLARVSLRSEEGKNALLPQTVQSETVAAAYSGFLEDVLQVDFHRSGSDSEFLSDLPVLETLFDKFHNLVFSGRKLRA